MIRALGRADPLLLLPQLSATDRKRIRHQPADRGPNRVELVAATHTARPELDWLEAELVPDELAAAREGAQAADFQAVVAAAHQILAGGSPALRS